MQTSRRAIVTGLIVMPAAARAESPTRVAAAADLRGVLEPIVRDVAAAGNSAITVTYGSSGNLSRQIEQGAPFDLFLAADESFAARLVAAGKTEGEGTIYAIGRLALIAGKSAPVAVDPDLKGLSEAMDKRAITRFAIANPEHAPYGARAREVLQRTGLWGKMQPRLVLGENVAQAAQFVASGAAEAGLVAASLLAAPEIANAVTASVVPAERHTPLRQRMVLMKGAGNAARALFEALQGPAARGALQRAGFGLP